MTDRRAFIVTGAAGALGRAVTDVLREQGTDVVGVDLHGEDVVHADIATAAGNELAVRAAVERHGRIDGLVLNAGVQSLAPLHAFDEAEWDRLQAIMLKGPWLLLRAAWDELTRRPFSRAVVVSSTSGFVAETDKAAYIAAKTGVLGLVRAAAVEGAPHGLTVNAVAPGWMWTPIVEQRVREYAQLRGWPEEEVAARLLERHAVKRFIEPREVAEAIGFLAGERASAVTGACLPVDLGYLAT